MAKRSRAAEWDAFDRRAFNQDREALKFGSLALGGGFGAVFGGLFAGQKLGAIAPIIGAVVGAAGGYALAGNSKSKKRSR